MTSATVISVGGTGQAVAPVRAALAGEEAGPAHVVEDALQELGRQALRLGERLRGQRRVGGGEGAQCPDGVVDLGRDVHGDRVFQTGGGPARRPCPARATVGRCRAVRDVAGCPAAVADRGAPRAHEPQPTASTSPTRRHGDPAAPHAARHPRAGRPDDRLAPRLPRRLRGAGLPRRHLRQPGPGRSRPGSTTPATRTSARCSATRRSPCPTCSPTWPPTPPACSTPSGSTGPTSSACRWAA